MDKKNLTHHHHPDFVSRTFVGGCTAICQIRSHESKHPSSQCLTRLIGSARVFKIFQSSFSSVRSFETSLGGMARIGKVPNCIRCSTTTYITNTFTCTITLATFHNVWNRCFFTGILSQATWTDRIFADLCCGSRTSISPNAAHRGRTLAVDGRTSLAAGNFRDGRITRIHHAIDTVNVSERA